MVTAGAETAAQMAPPLREFFNSPLLSSWDGSRSSFPLKTLDRALLF